MDEKSRMTIVRTTRRVVEELPDPPPSRAPEVISAFFECVGVIVQAILGLFIWLIIFGLIIKGCGLDR